MILKYKIFIAKFECWPAARELYYMNVWIYSNMGVYAPLARPGHNVRLLHEFELDVRFYL